MPYGISKGGGKRPWAIVDKGNGKVVSTMTTKSDAQRAVSARHAAENTAKPKKPASRKK